MESIYSVASSAVSVVYGSVTNAIKELLISQFRHGFFKYTNVSSEMAYRNMRRQYGGTNNRNEFAKREKPYMSIRPIFGASPEDVPFNNTPLTKNMGSVLNGVNMQGSFPILKDKENMYGLAYRMNRDRIEFNVTIALETQISQLDLYKNMENHMVWGIPIKYVFSLETIIPKTTIIQMGRILGLNLEDEKNPNVIPLFLQRINSISKYPISYKIKNSSGNDEFFLYFNHGVLVTLLDLDKEDGNLKNMVGDSYDVTFRIISDFNFPAVFLLYGDPGRADMLKVELLATDSSGINKDYIPLCTFNNLFNEYPYMKDGFKLYISSLFYTEKNAKEIDTLDTRTLFDNNVIQVITSNLKYHNDISTIVRIYVLKNQQTLIEDNNYTMDWNSLILTINEPDRYATYRIIIYINNSLINDTLIDMEEIYKNEKSFLKQASVSDNFKRKEEILIINEQEDYDISARREFPMSVEIKKLTKNDLIEKYNNNQ